MSFALPTLSGVELPGFRDEMRLWIYTASRELSPQETAFAKTYLDIFTGQQLAGDTGVSTWASHGKTLISKADILWQRVIVLAVDETSFGASGCSIDSSVRFLQQLADKLQVDLFDRMIFLHRLDADSLEAFNLDSLREAYASGQITDESMMVDTLVTHVAQARREMFKPLGQSWHKRLI